MTAAIHHETRHDHLALVFAERERLGLWRPTAFAFPRGIEAQSGETRQRLDPKDESPVRQDAAPLFSKDPTHASS
ncbi:hypothetical protein D9601_02585 [Sphingomonas sp. MA1305]|uniref:hypothetical protein n=1 Tax=Sphingomonas sp. MA1305 TaxID=2479204 RepID=UPI0018DF1016|nr:hypothetical protein [Sphingomonas sp. MA1305]MBI0474252.1 hypothetical protein [Sphingomonas sp. MA1305]